MRLATWNVNSLKARLPRVEEWIAVHEPDVLMLQETKCADATFPEEFFAERGYESVHHGNGRWNGVAIVSRVGLEQPRAGFFDEEASAIEECRVLAATCGGVRVFSVYVPNGRAVGTEHYDAKIAWLGRLRSELDQTCDPSDPVGLFGDFNVAPEDRDVWDITQFVGATHVTEPERTALSSLISWGLEDVVRHAHPDGDGPFSWWDYRAGSFHRGWGMRIDLALLSLPLAARVSEAVVDREARKGPQPSDHAPVVVDLSD